VGYHATISNFGSPFIRHLQVISPFFPSLFLLWSSDFDFLVIIFFTSSLIYTPAMNIAVFLLWWFPCFTWCSSFFSVVTFLIVFHCFAYYTWHIDYSRRTLTRVSCRLKLYHIWIRSGYDIVMPWTFMGRGQLPITALKIVNWSHKSPQAFPTCFVIAPTLPGNFPRGHPFQDCSPANTLNYEILKNRLPKRKVHLWWYR